MKCERCINADCDFGHGLIFDSDKFLMSEKFALPEKEYRVYTVCKDCSEEIYNFTHQPIINDSNDINFKM